MKRIDGYIDLDYLLNLKISKMPELEKYKKLKKRMKDVKEFKIIKEEDFYLYDNNIFVFSFEINGEKYFFKYDSESAPYYDLIASEIASEIGLPSVQYDLAKLGKYRGTISLNYKKEGAKYISGKELLKEFYYYDPYSELYYGDNNKERKDMMHHNNLMDIWHALENRYRNRKDMQEIVKNLMEKLLKLQVFDLITGQNDRHIENYGIVEYEDGSVDLQPIFDNSRMFLEHQSNHDLVLSPEKEYYKLIDVSRYLYNVSDTDIQNYILGCLWVISEKNIINIISRVESKIECSIPDNIKKSILYNFKDQYDYILNSINNYKIDDGRSI